MWPSPPPAGASCFAAGNVHVIDVANLSNCSEAVLVNPADFARRHFYQRVSGFQCSKGCLLPGTARYLTALPGGQFDIVNVRAERDCAQRQRISQIRWSIIPSDNSRSHFESTRRENVAHFSIAVFDQSNARRTIRVV